MRKAQEMEEDMLDNNANTNITLGRVQQQMMSLAVLDQSMSTIV
jgi:hypothetical protein